jgi:hypothetical protein
VRGGTCSETLGLRYVGSDDDDDNDDDDGGDGDDDGDDDGDGDGGGDDDDDDDEAGGGGGGGVHGMMKWRQYMGSRVSARPNGCQSTNQHR